MDPQAALDLAGHALISRDTLRAAEHLLAYYQWRVRGGHQPPNGDVRAEMMSAQLLDQMEKTEI